MNLQRAKLNFIVNTFIPFTWILYYHVIYPFFSFTEILNSCFFNHLKNILHSLTPFPLQLSCTTPRFCPYLFSFVTLYSNYLFRCLLPFHSNITLKTAFLPLYVGTLPFYMRRKQKLHKYLSN